MIVRAALPSDAAAIAAVHIASSDDSYAPLARTWSASDPIERAAKWEKSLADSSTQTFVAEANRVVLGFTSRGPARRIEPGVPFEIYVIHVHPASRGRGVGEALWAAACAEPGDLYVDTLAELRCCSFYERHGGTLIERRPIDFKGATRTHVTYRWARSGKVSA